MADTSILGRALMEAGRQLSLSSQNAGGGSGAAPIPPSTKGYHPAAVDPAQALLPKIDLLNKKMSTVEGLLSAQPDAIVQGLTNEIRNSLDGLGAVIADFKQEVSTQNEIARETLAVNRDLKKLVHVMSVMMVDLSRKGPLVGTEVSTECARQLNQFIEPGAIDTPIAYVGPPIRSRGRTSFPGATFDIDFYPRTGDDIGGLSERQLREMLLKLGAASPGLLERLDLEHLQELLMKHLGILM